jgi:hypothetical protein
MRIFESRSDMDQAIKAGSFLFKPEFGPAAFRCSVCNEAKPLNTDGVGACGYGVNACNEFVCFECCGNRDKEEMRATGKAVLYLTMQKAGSVGMSWHEGKPAAWFRRNGRGLEKYVAQVSNWPGTLKLNVSGGNIGRHNWAGVRYDVYFMFEGEQWHGVTYGDMTQLCHCRKLKDQRNMRA